MTATRPHPAPRRVLVLGGTGFIGRHAVAALLRAGCEVIVGTRHPARRPRYLGGTALACPRREARMERLTDPVAWQALIADVDTVLNCVGILRPRGGETYRDVHHRGPAALAAACRTLGVRLVHVSALGLREPVRSGFLHSKREGEDAIRTSGADWCIVRPSLLDGEGGFGARWMRRVARWPLHALPADANGRIAALDVAELGEALARLATMARLDAADREYELGGLDERPLGDYLAVLRRGHSPVPALRLALPAWLARLASHACDLLHLTPYSFGHYELLRHDNCPRPNRLPELLGRPPRRIGAEPWPSPVIEAIRNPIP